MSTTKTGKQGALCVGMEVTAVGPDGTPWAITRILRQGHGGKGWYTPRGRYDGEGGSWTQGGLEENRQIGNAHRMRIVPTNDEHRHAIWCRQMRDKFANAEMWDKATAEQIEAVAKIMGIPMWDAQKEGK